MIPKRQLISKCLIGVFNFFQKTNKNKSTWGFIVVKSNSSCPGTLWDGFQDRNKRKRKENCPPETFGLLYSRDSFGPRTCPISCGDLPGHPVAGKSHIRVCTCFVRCWIWIYMELCAPMGVGKRCEKCQVYASAHFQLKVLSFLSTSIGCINKIVVNWEIEIVLDS